MWSETCISADVEKSKDDALVHFLYAKGKQMNGISYSLAKVDWSVFATLTWRDRSRSYNSSRAESLRQEDFKRFITMVCIQLKLRARNLAYYCKAEFGASDNGHYNVLIARNGTKGIASSVIAHEMLKIWTEFFGVADIQPFKEHLQREGASYQAKYELGKYWSRNDPSEYRSKALDRLIFGTVHGVAENALLQPVANAESVSFCDTL